MPNASLRPRFARDGIFNVRDLGGLRSGDGRQVATGRLVRADALHRARSTADDLRRYGVVRVLDLRDERERDEEGVLGSPGIEVVHLPVLDPAFDWVDDSHDDFDTMLAHRYQVILESFPDRFAEAVGAVVEVVAKGSSGAVAYHCAVGKDRTGLLTALLLGLLGVPDETVIDDYTRSGVAVAVQVSWLWSMGYPAGHVAEEHLENGLWSARPETMRRTLDWLAGEHGGAASYMRSAGLDDDQIEALRRALLVEG